MFHGLALGQPSLADAEQVVVFAGQTLEPDVVQQERYAMAIDHGRLGRSQPIEIAQLACMVRCALSGSTANTIAAGWPVTNHVDQIFRGATGTLSGR